AGALGLVRGNAFGAVGARPPAGGAALCPGGHHAGGSDGGARGGGIRARPALGIGAVALALGPHLGDGGRVRELPAPGARAAFRRARPEALGACPGIGMVRAPGACEAEARSEEDSDAGASSTTSDAAYARNP